MPIISHYKKEESIIKKEYSNKNNLLEIQLTEI